MRVPRASSLARPPRRAQLSLLSGEGPLSRKLRACHLLLYTRWVWNLPASCRQLSKGSNALRFPRMAVVHDCEARCRVLRLRFRSKPRTDLISRALSRAKFTRVRRRKLLVAIPCGAARSGSGASACGADPSGSATHGSHFLIFTDGFGLAPKYQGFPETTLFHSGVFSKTPWLALALKTMPVRGLPLPQGHFVAVGYRS